MSDGVPKNVKRVAVYPAYVVVRGSCKEVFVPAFWQQPCWPGKLLPIRSVIERDPRRLSDVPICTTNIEAYLQSVGTLKQKLADLERWRKGVHQVFLSTGAFSPIKIFELFKKYVVCNLI